jgi:hypothetical protein
MLLNYTPNIIYLITFSLLSISCNHKPIDQIVDDSSYYEYFIDQELFLPFHLKCTGPYNLIIYIDAD